MSMGGMTRSDGERLGSLLMPPKISFAMAFVRACVTCLINSPVATPIANATKATTLTEAGVKL